jgi:hypothetical protein
VPIAHADGGGLVSRRVLDGERPRWVYRSDPIDETDTGWRLLEGNESDDWLNAPGAANCIFMHVRHFVEKWPELATPLADPRAESQWEWVASAGAYADVTDPDWSPAE